ncbi:helix-turn-helix transcriptional regulator [bacterium]|nr:helix-turn-helix transcriptional regulator [bacterium]
MIQILCGHCEVSSGQQTESIGPGEAFFKRASERSRVRFFGDPDAGGFVAARWIRMDFVLWGTIEVPGLLEMPLRLTSGAAAPYGAIIEETLRSSPAQRLQPLAALTRRSESAHRVLRLICNSFPLRIGNLERLQNIQRLEPVFRYLYAHLGDPIDVPSLARLTRLSRPRFHAIFQSHMGMPPMRYVRNLRLGEAGKRLLQGDEPIRIIAAEVGFANPFHFSREFKARFGMSPSEYRRSRQAWG